MDRGSFRRPKPNSNRPRIGLIPAVTIAAFVIAAMFAILILRDRHNSSDSGAAPTVTPAVQATATAAAPTLTPVSTPHPATPTTTGALEPTSAPPYLQSNDPDIAAAVDGLIADKDGVYGVLITKPDGTVLYSKNSETPFVAASLYKLVLLADIYRKIDAGTVDRAKQLVVLASDFEVDNGEDSYFTTENVGASFTVERLLFATGAYSSNVAAKMLLTLTNPNSLANEAALLGMTGTHLFVNPSDLANWPPAAAPDSTDAEIAQAVAFDVADAAGAMTNLTTPADMARYFQLLLAGKIVSKSASAEILDTLKTQMIDDRFPALLPSGTEMAHKTGNLDFVVHDVGIIYSPTGPVILIAMVEADSDDNIPTAIEQRLALIAFGTLDVPPLDDGTGTETPNPDNGNADAGSNASDGNADTGAGADGGNADQSASADSGG